MECQKKLSAMKIRQKITRDLALGFFSRFFHMFVSYAVLFIMARYLKKEEMGAFFFAASIATFAVMFANLGTRDYLMRRAATKPGESAQYLSETLSFRLPLFVVYFLLINLSMFLVRPDIMEVTLITSTYVLLDECSSTFTAIFLGVKKILYDVVGVVISKAVLLGLILLAVQMEWGFLYVISCHIMANAVWLSIVYWIMGKKIGTFQIIWDLKIFRRVMTEALPFFLLTFLYVAHSKIDTLMLGLMKTYAVVATYEASYKLLEASRFILQPVSMVFFPLFVEMAGKDDWKDIRRLFQKMVFALGLLAVGIVCIVVVAADIIIPLVYGPKYFDSIPILRILFLAVPMIYLGSVSGLLAFSIHMEKKVVRAFLYSVAINIILNSLFIPRWGAFGAAWTTVVSETILAVYLLGLVFFELKTKRQNGVIEKTC
jgi:O-antigen/teichoic acid export membrane protein